MPSESQTGRRHPQPRRPAQPELTRLLAEIQALWHELQRAPPADQPALEVRIRALADRVWPDRDR